MASKVFFNHSFIVNCSSFLSEEETYDEIKANVDSICGSWQDVHFSGGLIDEHYEETKLHRYKFYFEGCSDNAEAGLQIKIEDRLSHFECMIDDWEIESFYRELHKNRLTPDFKNSRGNSTKDSHHKKSKNLVSKIIAKSLPSYAKILLSDDVEEQKQVLKTSPELLQRLLARHALYVNPKFEQETQAEYLDLFEKQVVVQKEITDAETELYKKFHEDLDYRVDVMMKSTDYNVFLWLESSAYLFETFAKEDQKAQDIKEQITKELQESFKLWITLQELGDDHPNLAYIEDQWTETNRTIEILTSALRKHIETIVPESANLLDSFGCLNENVSRDDANRAQEAFYINGLASEYDRLLKMRSRFDCAKEHTQLQKIEADLFELCARLKEIEVQKALNLSFKPQDMNAIIDSLEKDSRRHVVFSDSLFEDGLFYVSNQTKSVSTRVGTLNTHAVDLGLLSPQKTQDVQKAWQSLDEETKKVLAAGLGFDERGKLKGSINKMFFKTTQPGEDEIRAAFEKMLPSLFYDLPQHQRESPKFEHFAQQYQKALFAFAQQEGYRDYKRTWKSEGETLLVNGYIDQANEAQIIQKLTTAGATLAPNQLPLPEYESWTTLKQGFGYKLQKGETSLTFIPREISTSIPCYQTKIDFEKHRPEMIKRVTEFYKKHTVRKQDLAYCISEKGEMHLVDISQKRVLENSLNAWFRKENGYEKFKGDLEKGPTKIDGAFIPLPGIKTDRMYTVYSLKDIQQESGLSFEGIVKTVQADSGSDPHFVEFQDSLLIERAHGGVYNKILRKLNNETLFRINFDTEEDSYNWRKNIENRSTEELITDLMRTRAFSEQWVEKTEIQAGGEQTVPRAERGRLFIETNNFEDAQKMLEEVGAVKEWHKEIPKDLLQGSVSKVSVPLNEYLEKSPILPLDQETRIIHGMTGVEEDYDEMEKRLNRIFELDGLFSIRTRRHHGMSLKTLSPLGDIASGIDHGVPATMGVQPIYGDGVFFVMRNSLLQNKNIWFSDTDYGGGHDRAHHYDEYAKSIGQDDHYQAPSHFSRVKHIEKFKKGLLSSDNEVFFEDGIALNEIGAILVDAQLLPRVSLLFKKAKASGQLRPDVVVKTIHDNDKSEIAKLIKRLPLF